MSCVKKWMFIAIIVFCMNGTGFAKDSKKTDSEAYSKTSDEILIAVGDGLKVFTKDASDMRVFMDKNTIYRLKDDGYRNMAILMVVFAQESKALGLDNGKEIGDTFESKLRLSNLYGAKVLKEYQISDLIIESYYLAHPDKYQADGKLRPLDDKLKEEIRAFMAMLKKFEIQDAALNVLKQKYHVRICDDKGECK